MPALQVICTTSRSKRSYNFADEAFLLTIKRSIRKFKVSLLHHSYRNVGSICFTKSQKLFPIIEPILKAYGIPEDFKYIPLVESGLKRYISKRGRRFMAIYARHRALLMD